VVTKSSIFWDISLVSPLKIVGDSEEHIASIFNIENSTKKKQREVRNKQFAYKWSSNYWHEIILGRSGTKRTNFSRKLFQT
jgi:hypothetical protein